jgi:hypothetical protein
VTVDPVLLKAVDGFVAEHPDQDRSKVVDAALFLWYAQQEEQAIEADLRAPRSEIEKEERAAWRQIQQAAAERIFWPPQRSDGGS